MHLLCMSTASTFNTDPYNRTPSQTLCRGSQWPWFGSLISNPEGAVIAARWRSKWRQEQAAVGVYKGVLFMAVGGILKARTGEGWRTMLPAKL